MTEPQALLELQSVDVEILRATKRLEDLPEKTAILQARAKIRDTAALKQKAELLVRKLDAEIKARADETATLTEKIETEQTKIMETADHRQVQAITREMDGLRRRADKLEMESLQFMERAEKARSQMDTIDEALQSLAAKEAELIARYKQVGGEVQKEIAVMQKKREKLVAALDERIVAEYEKLRQAKGGIGVGRLDDTTCTACRMSLPSEKIKGLLAGPDVGTCPQCRRLIVVRGGGDQ